MKTKYEPQYLHCTFKETANKRGNPKITRYSHWDKHYFQLCPRQPQQTQWNCPGYQSGQNLALSITI